MLVIGFTDGQNSAYAHELDVDVDVDSPRKIHDTLKKSASGTDFTTIICVENDTVVGHFIDGEDYDLSVDENAEEEETDDEDGDDDNLHEDDEDDDDLDD